MQKDKTRESTMKRLIHSAGKRKYLMFASWIIAAISAVLAIVPLVFIWLVLKEAIEIAPNFTDTSNLIFNGGMAVLCAVLAILVYFLALMCSHCSAFRVATNLRIQGINHITKLPLGMTDELGSGKLRQTINDTAAQTETFLAHQLPDSVFATVTMLCVLCTLFVFDWRLGLLSLVPVALSYVVMLSMTGQRMKKSMEEYKNSLDNMSNSAVEYVRGVPVVKTFGQTIYSFKKFKDSIDGYDKFVVDYSKQCRAPMIAYTVLINSIFAFLIAGAYWFAQGGISTELIINLVFYVILTPSLGVTLTKIMFQSENSLMVKDAIDRIDQVLDLEPLVEPTEPVPPHDTSIAMQNVCFSYDGKKDAVHNMTFDITSGSKVAFVGPSGGGKSTIANLISRFFDPQQGEVKIGGVNVKDIGKQKLMENISFVFQNSRLLKLSILDNVRLGNPNATREQVLKALEQAQCNDIIAKLPNGIDTMIGSKGTYLSGGEQQRICIARAILKDSKIILLDEATAFADPDNEVKIQQALNNLFVGKTVVMIAHRLTTIVNVDEIFVVKDGEIVEQGNFKELVGKNGLFSEMWNDYQNSTKWQF